MNKTNLRLSLGALCILFSLIAHSAFAAAIGAEVALYTPWTFVNTTVRSFLTSKPQTFQSDIPQLDLNIDPLTWHLSDLHWKVTANLTPGKWDAQNFEVSAKNIRFILDIQKLAVDQYIDQVVGGAVLHVHVQALCGPITLTQNSAEAAARLNYQVEPQQISTQVSAFDLQWPADSWQISEVSCVGPAGFDQTMKQALIQQLRNAEQIKPWIKTVVSQKLQESVNAVIAKLALPTPLPTSQIPTPMVLNLKTLQVVSEGVIATGVLRWSNRNDDSDIIPLDLKELPSALAKSKVPQLITRTTALTELIQVQLKSLKSPTQMDMKQFPFFVKLLKSRLQQTFAWPDLWNYSSSDPFWLRIPIPQNLNLKWQKDGSATFGISSTGVIVSKRDDKNWNYINLRGQALGTLVPSISKSNLKVAITLSHSQFAAQMNEPYVSHFGANTYLRPSMIKNIQEAMNQSLGYTAELPSLNLGPVGIAMINGWQAQDEGLLSLPILLRAP